MKLSIRLEAIAAMVSPCRTLADIGTDHAHVPIALVERGMADAAIAMDVREGPLSRARENISLAGMTDRIDTRLSDGLAALMPGEADVILIAGMGGALMQRILQDGRRVAHEAQELVVQPQSEIAEFRRFLRDEGYRICDENMVYEDGKYYTIMKAVWDEKTKELLQETDDDIFAEYGPCLLMKKDPVLLEYLKKEQLQLQRILDAMPQVNACIGRQENEIEQMVGSPDAGDRITKRRKELCRKLEQNHLAQQVYMYKGMDDEL